MGSPKILVTGADGFIGSHLVELLVQKGARVRALAQYNSFNHWGWLEDVSCLSEIEVITGDIRDSDSCVTFTKDIDVVFHLAALIGIPYSYQSPRSYIDTNVTGTFNICNAALKNNCSRVVLTSTSEVYGTARYVPIDEKHPLQPQSPYSASKISSDAMGMSFFHTFQLPVVLARPFNTYGPRQSARAVIPTIITQLLDGRTEIGLGDMTPTRDFTFVADTCEALLALSQCTDAIGETVNIGTGSEISIQNLFETIQKLTGKTAAPMTEEERKRPKTSEVMRLVCQNEKLRGFTGFKPQTTLETGLRKTIDWFGSPTNRKKYKVDTYNV